MRRIRFARASENSRHTLFRLPRAPSARSYQTRVPREAPAPLGVPSLQGVRSPRTRGRGAQPLDVVMGAGDNALGIKPTPSLNLSHGVPARVASAVVRIAWKSFMR